MWPLKHPKRKMFDRDGYNGLRLPHSVLPASVYILYVLLNKMCSLVALCTRLISDYIGVHAPWQTVITSPGALRWPCLSHEMTNNWLIYTWANYPREHLNDWLVEWTTARWKRRSTWHLRLLAPLSDIDSSFVLFYSALSFSHEWSHSVR